MTEGEFWSALEYRICRELRGFDGRLSNHWCDGIIGGFSVELGFPAIVGRIWIGHGGQDERDFAMHLPPDMDVPEKIDWERLYPAENLTGWLLVDEGTRRVEIDITRAEPM